jgi:dTDP-4-amino-4,6-dideoxygalactose transaminase
MKFVDLKKEYFYFKDDIDVAVKNTFNSGRYLFGDNLERFQNDFSSFVGKKYGIGVKNCTDAILLTLRATWKEGMPIILPNFGAYPTAVAAKNITSNLYYVDVDDTLTIDPNKLPDDVKGGIVIVVHLFGNNCDMEKITEYCKKNNHILIEDCAQSTGSGSGVHGDYSVFSFYPTKPLAAMGDGGMICTDHDPEIFEKLRFYGYKPGTDNIDVLGINSRLDEVQSSILNVKLKKFTALNDKRREVCRRYQQIVKGFRAREGCVFHQFVVRFKERDVVIENLDKQKIPYIIHYKKHSSEVPALSGVHNHVGFRVSENCLSFPCHPFLEEQEIQVVEDFLRRFKDYEI